MRALRSLLWIAAVCGACLLVPPAAMAQSGGPAGAAADTLNRPVFGFFQPTYDSNYSINQQQTQWTQNFKFANQFGGFSLDNRTTYSVKTDPNRTDFIQKSGNTASSFAYTLLNRIPTTASISFTRNTVNNTGRQTLGNYLDAGFNGTYNWRPIRGIQFSSKGGVGITRRKDTNAYGGDETGAREFGLTRNASATVTYNRLARGMIFKLDTSIDAARTKPDPINPTIITPQATEPKTNTRTSSNLGWSYTPVDGMDAKVDYSWGNSDDSYIVVSPKPTDNGRLESAVDRNQNLRTSFNYKPKADPSTEVNLSYKVLSTTMDRQVEQEKARSVNSRSLDAKFARKLFGSPLFLHLENSNDEINSPLLPAVRKLSRILDGSLERPWSPKLSTRLQGEVRLISQKYSDHVLDLDQLRDRMEIYSTYTPWSRFSATVSGSRSFSQDVNIDSTQSGNSRQEENYGAAVALKLAVTSRTNITQRYSFSEMFTSFRFNPSQDNMQRTREVATSVSTSLSRELTLMLEHKYQFRETGGYRRDGGGTRYFSRSDLHYEQDMRATVSYRATGWLTFDTSERFFRIDDVSILFGTRRPRFSMELTENANFTRPIPGGGTLTGSAGFWFQKLVKPVEGKPDGFFNANLSLSKPF